MVVEDVLEQLVAGPARQAGAQPFHRLLGVRDEGGHDTGVVRAGELEVLAGDRQRAGVAEVQHRGPAARQRGGELLVLEHGAQAVGHEDVHLAEALQGGRPGPGRGELGGDVLVEAVARHHARGAAEPVVQQGEERQAERGEGVGHHLPVAVGDVHVVPAVVRGRHGVERGDGAALQHVQAVVGQGPLDVLRLAVVRLDPPAQALQTQDLGVGELLDALSFRLDRLLQGAAAGGGAQFLRLHGDRPADDPPAPDPVVVGVDQPRDERLPEAEPGVDRDHVPVAGDRVSGEHDARRVGEDHLLDHHRQPHGAVLEAVPDPVGHRPVGEQRRPAPPHAVDHRGGAADVEVGVLLPGEGAGGQVLGGRAGTHRARHAVAARLLQVPGDLAPDLLRHAQPLDDGTQPRRGDGDRLAVVRPQPGQPVDQRPGVRVLLHDLPVGLGGDAEPVRDLDAADGRQLPEVGALASGQGEPLPAHLAEPEHVRTHG